MQRMMQVTGEEGVSLGDYLIWLKSVLLDMVYLQQDAFDAAMSRERQLESFELVKRLVDADFDFPDRDAARDFFTRLTGLYKNWNYAAPDSPEFERYRSEITQLADQHRVGAQGEPTGESADMETPA
jgi:V/A-type H+-transporting ATPase subunit A